MRSFLPTYGWSWGIAAAMIVCAASGCLIPLSGLVLALDAAQNSVDRALSPAVVFALVTSVLAASRLTSRAPHLELTAARQPYGFRLAHASVVHALLWWPLALAMSPVYSAGAWKIAATAVLGYSLSCLLACVAPRLVALPQLTIGTIALMPGLAPSEWNPLFASESPPHLVLVVVCSSVLGVCCYATIGPFQRSQHGLSGRGVF